MAREDAGDLPGHVTASLKVALRNSEELPALVSDLLTAATGGSTVSLEPADLTELIQSAVSTAAPRGEINGVQS